MFLKSFDDRMLAAFGRLVAALSDPARRYRVAFVACLVYAAMWALYATVAKSSQGMNADLGEMTVWARNLAWGYPKHPPFPALILAGWFAVFPEADWAYYLLAGLNLGLGLYFCFLAAGLWLDGEKQVVVPFFLALIPFYNFLGLKFDQNSILIPLWALTTWAFVLSFRHRHIGYAALAGAAAAAAVLTKYWSVFILLSLGIAVLCDSRRAAYLRSAAPWTTVLVGGVLVAPHAVWLVQNNFPPLNWVGRRITHDVAEWLSFATEYLFGTVAYASVALVIFLVLMWPSMAAWRDLFVPRDRERRMVAIVFWLLLLLPIAVAVVTKGLLLAIWNTPSLGLLPIVLLSSPLIVVSRTAATRIVAFATTVSVLALLASPVVAALKLRSGVENNATYVPAAVAAVQKEWDAATDRPLQIVAGPFTLVSSLAFSLEDRPSTFSDFSSYLSPWVDADALLRKGIAVICPNDDRFCLADLDKLGQQRPVARRVDVELRPSWLGMTGPGARFIIAVLPPR